MGILPVFFPQWTFCVTLPTPKTVKPPGKDSHRHRDAGVSVVGICSRSMHAVFWPPNNERDAHDAVMEERMYAKFAPMFHGCDLVLVEGDSKTKATKLEVWRSEVGGFPIAKSDASISAVNTDASQLANVAAPLWHSDLMMTRVRRGGRCVPFRTECLSKIT